MCFVPFNPSINFNFNGLLPWDLTYTNGTTISIVDDINSPSYAFETSIAGIYEILLADDVNDCVADTTIVGIAEVRDVFRSPKFGLIAGCMVTEGTVSRSKPIRVLRDSIVIYEGELESLRRFKDDASEVRNGTECGIGVKNYTDVKVGDLIEVFEVNEVARSL